MLFFKKRRQQTSVIVKFFHGHGINLLETPLPVEIKIKPGQEFITGIGTDAIWEGDTVIAEYNWKAGFSRSYEYIYEGVSDVKN